MITRLFVFVFIVANAYSQTILFRIDFNDYPTGSIYNIHQGRRSDLLPQVISEKISLRVKEEGLEYLVGQQDQLFFLVSRITKTGPVSVQAVYTRRDKNGSRLVGHWEPVLVTSETDSEINKLVEGVKKNIRPSPTIIMPSKSTAQIKAQPREGGGAFCLQIKTSVAKEEES